MRAVRAAKMLRVAVVVAWSLGLAGTAWAQESDDPPSGERDASRPAEFELPAIAEEDDVEYSELADKQRDDVIAKLREIIPTYPETCTPTACQKADLMFRLAERYWEKSKFLYFQEVGQFDQAYAEYSDKLDQGEQATEPELESFVRGSKVYKKQALEIYRRILDDYPNYQRRDEVLFIVAYNHNEAGNKDEAVRHYFRLIQEFPESSYVPDAYLAMGEMFFSENLLAKAIRAYSSALDFPDSRSYVFALYKLGWCDFNGGDYRAAIEKWKDVVAYSDEERRKLEQEGRLLDSNRIRLKEEALRDLVLGFSQIDAVVEMRDYLVTVTDPAMVRRFVTRLAAIYDEQGKDEQAIDTYRMMLGEYPDSAEAPKWQKGIITAYHRKGDLAHVREEIINLVTRYGRDSAWAKVNADKPEVIEKAYKMSEEALRSLATEYHANAQKDRREATYAIAQDIYAEYLKYFPNTEFNDRMQFYYAEILFLREFYKDAAEQYDDLVENQPDSKFAEKSAYASILAYEKLVAGFKRSERGRPAKLDEKKDKGEVQTQVRLEKLEEGKTYEAKEVPELEQLLIAACDRWVGVTEAPLEEKLPVQFRAGSIYYGYYHFEEAAKRFGDIIDAAPEHKLARLSVQYILDSFETQKDWRNLNIWSRHFMENERLTSNEAFKAKLQRLIEGATFNEILLLQKEEKFAEAAQQFRQYVRDFPDSEFSDTALYNAVVIFDRAEQLDWAIEVGEQLLRDYPKTVHAENVRWFLATFYERTADFDTAARYYEKFANDYKKSDRRPDALYNAALFNDGMDRPEEAVRLYETYVREYSKRDDVADIYWRIGLIYERLEQWPKAARFFDRYTERYGRKAKPARRVDADYRQALALLQINRKYKAEALFRSIMQRFPRLDEEARKHPRVLKAMAHAKYRTIEPKIASYMKMRLRLPTRRLARDLENKAKALTGLENQLAELLAVGDGEYGIAALYHLGMAYQDFANALFDAPIPRQLDAEQIEIYQAELQATAFPVEEKAIEAFIAAVNKAYEIHIYSDWAVKAQAELAKFQPGEFRDVLELPYRGSSYFSRSGPILPEGVELAPPPENDEFAAEDEPDAESTEEQPEAGEPTETDGEVAPGAEDDTAADESPDSAATEED